MKTVFALGLLAVASGIWSMATRDAAGLVSGEAVYVSEGCIHCHSQFSRPDSLDTEIYGPATLPGSHSGAAVLIGNRRQGPDLSAVGLRRSRQWNREHLIDPQLLSPGTRMPSYRHLFEGSGERGEALLDYLAGLGAENAAAWYRNVAAWSAPAGNGDAERGRELYARLCQQCHGPTGGGDGVVAERFSPRPTRFSGGGLRFAPEALPPEVRTAQLSRIVKYGIAGAPMPGHEYLTDGEVADLVAFVGAFSVRSEAGR